MSDAWKARLLPASFRGIPFFIDNHELSGGRNVVSHEPIDRDSSFSEDTGRKSKSFTIEGHILGDNYFFLRDALEDAMDDSDEGTLIHPYLGLKTVRPGSYSIREENTQGRICYFTLQFIEAGEKSFPIAAIDAVTDLLTSVVSAVAFVQNAFQVAFSVAQLPGFAVEKAVLLVTNFTRDIRSGLANLRLKPEEKAKILKALDDIDDDVETLVQNEATLAAEIDNIAGQLGDAVQEPDESTTIDTNSGRDEKLVIFDSLINYDAAVDSIPENTPTRISEKNNALAFQSLIKGIGLSRLSEQAGLKDYNSVDQAVSIRKDITDKINEELSIVSDDDSFQALEDLKAKLVKAVPNENDNLAVIKEVEISIETPSLVLAYDLYEDQSFEQDIIDRNKIRNPGFILGTIEVLSG